jgi:predicted nucleic acid-binding protein
MRLAHSNVWLALALSKHEFHGAARTWLARQAPRQVLFCRSTHWMDAYLAAFALAGGHQLVTTDKAFNNSKGSTSSYWRNATPAGA